MRCQQIDKPSDSTAAVTTLRMMQLYIVGDAPNSIQALANLERICQQHLQGNYQLEVVDVLDQPLRALADGVIVTPSLIKQSPLPVTQIVGNLSHPSNVLLALGLQGTSG